LGLIADPVRNGTHGADSRIFKVPQKADKPPGRDNGVVVEQHQNLPAGKREALIVGRREAAVLVVEDDPDLRMIGDKLAEVRARLVDGRVVNNDDLVVWMLGIQ
jgi:hypothetical protein